MILQPLMMLGLVNEFVMTYDIDLNDHHSSTKNTRVSSFQKETTCKRKYKIKMLKRYRNPSFLQVMY